MGGRPPLLPANMTLAVSSTRVGGVGPLAARSDEGSQCNACGGWFYGRHELNEHRMLCETLLRSALGAALAYNAHSDGTVEAFPDSRHRTGWPALDPPRPPTVPPSAGVVRPPPPPLSSLPAAATRAESVE